MADYYYRSGPAIPLWVAIAVGLVASVLVVFCWYRAYGGKALRDDVGLVCFSYSCLTSLVMIWLGVFITQAH